MKKVSKPERGTYPLSGLFRERDLLLRVRGILLPYGFLAPSLIIVLLFFFIPLVMVFILSFTNLDMTNFGILEWWRPTNWSLDNYVKIFTNRFFPKILGNTAMYTALTLAFFNMGMALVIALITTHINRRAGFAFRALWLLPRLTPVVVYIMMWKALAGPAPMGVINKYFLGPLGIGSGEYLLHMSPWVFIILVNGFIGASFGIIIFSAAIEAIPKDYLIASKVDGATTWQTIRHVTIPMIKWPLLFVTTYQTLSLLTSFEYIMLLTDGGPGLYQTEVWALTAYHRALSSYFGNIQWGYGAAWSVVLVIIGIVMAVVYLRVFKFGELVEEPKIDRL